MLRRPKAQRLFGKRVMLRALEPGDFEAWSEIRIRNDDWLTPWEPRRSASAPDPAREPKVFANRCTLRDRDQLADRSYAFGVFVEHRLVGEVNLNNVIRGALQGASIGYWVDQAAAGNGYIAEAVVVVLKYAFEHLRLHRVEICVVPRNHRSRRVMEKVGLRDEGIALRYLEINGVWEDHVRYAITVEEWKTRQDEFAANWLVS